MQYFKKWSENRNPFLAFLCHSYAVGAPMAYRLLEAIQDDESFGTELTQPPLKRWLKLYKRHRLVRNSLIGFFHDPTGSISSDKDIFEKTGQLIDATPGHIPIHYLEETTNLFFNVSSPCSPLTDLQTFADCPEETFQTQYDEKAVAQAFNRPESYFFMRIYLPCYLLYGTFPARLLRHARQGDNTSLENLFRLDSSAIFDDKISKLMHNLRTSDTETFETLTSFLSKPPKKKITLQKVKVLFAGLISFMSAIFDSRLTEPEIRALFDAVAKDDGLGEIDTDLPESPEAFAKAINREIPFWMSAFTSDKK